MNKTELIHNGVSKKVYATDEADKVIIEYTDTITASIFAFMTAINRMDGMAQRVKFRALKSTPDTITAFKATSGQH